MIGERHCPGLDWDRRGGRFRKRYVYFARIGQYVKVGFSVNPERRVKNLRSADVSAPADLDRTAPIELLKVLPGGPEVETAAHWALTEFHESGEWFHAAPEVLEAVAAFDGWPFPHVTKSPACAPPGAGGT